MRTGLAQKVREAARRFSGPFSSRDLVAALDVRTYRACRDAVSVVVRDMRRRGELEVLDRGLYRYLARHRERTKLDIVWHLARSHRQFSTDEIERLSGGRRKTVIEYLHCLRRLGYLRQIRVGHWSLVKDPGPATPANTGKCEKLRKARDK